VRETARKRTAATTSQHRSSASNSCLKIVQRAAEIAQLRIGELGDIDVEARFESDDQIEETDRIDIERLA